MGDIGVNRQEMLASILKFPQGIEGNQISGEEACYLYDICCGLSNATVIEVGSALGQGSTFAMYHGLMNGSSNRLIYVDCWEVFTDRGTSLKYSYETFLQNVLNNKLRISLIKDWSVNAAGLLKDNIADIIFIDGSHQEDVVHSDIMAWKPKLKVGGIFCGHDYNQPQVSAVVDRLLGKVNVCGTIWNMKTS